MDASKIIAEQFAPVLKNTSVNMGLTELEGFLSGTVAAPEGERPEEWVELLAPAADPATKRRLNDVRTAWVQAAKSASGGSIRDRLVALRKEMAAQGLAGFIVPRADEHQGEYVPKRAERLAWISNFTGSAGLVIVLQDRAAVFVDGRYTIQVREQVDAGLFEIRHVTNEPPEAWLAQHLKKGDILGFDPWLVTPDAAQRFREAAR